ncbi:MAG TPA: serine/threonine-protein kinase, partial [Gemmataceae bacterium]|nr:serine/threonine-protein kinase [Gemmataceae bacterium]
MPECPSDIDLSGFLDESLPADQLAVLSSHVDGCPSCQARLDRLTEGPDSPAARYKELPSMIGAGSRTGWLSGPRTEVGPDAQIPEVHPDAATQLLGDRSPLSSFTGLPSVPGFDVIAELGRGGMGVVYKARHRGLHRLCALKMILAGGAADPKIVQRFQFEAEVLARVQHPQVVQVYEADTFTGPTGVPIPYLAMELLEGGSLSRRLRDPDGKGQPMPPHEAAGLIEGIARAVHAAHLQGVVHRDLKPGNILFESAERGARSAESKPAESHASSSSDSAPLPKVTDFGLAKFTQDVGSDLTTTGQIVGTPSYMAPEQARGERIVGPATDVYGLGAILFHCLAGQPPFDGADPMSVLLRVINDPPPNLQSLCPTVHRDLAAVAARCLEKESRRRYAAASDLADDLRRFLENRPTVARPLRRRERLWLWTKRNPAVAGLLAALASVLVVGFTLVTVLWVRAEEKASAEHRALERAKDAERNARDAQGKTADALQEVQRQKAHLEFDHAVALCEEGQVEAGLERFLLTLELAEANDLPDLARVCRVNLAAWPAALARDRLSFHHGPAARIPVFTPDG